MCVHFLKFLSCITLNKSIFLKLAYSCTHINNILPEKINCYFKTAGTTHGYNLRSVANENYEQHQAKGLYGLKVIQYTGVKLWNQFPSEIKNQKILMKFVNLFKCYETGIYWLIVSREKMYYK